MLAQAETLARYPRRGHRTGGGATVSHRFPRGSKDKSRYLAAIAIGIGLKKIVPRNCRKIFEGQDDAA